VAEVKWIKITTDIFDDEKILLIESLPDAYAIITVWFKLLCLAGKQNNSGVFMMNHQMPYTDKMLATIFRMKEATVTMALQTFQQFGMVEVIDGVITIPNWGKHQNLDQLESKKAYMRGYMKEYRKKQQALTSGKPNCKTNSKTNVSQADKERDKEREKEEEKNNKNNIVRHKFGEYKNVLLSDEDVEKLKTEFPTDWVARIENLSSYIASTGKKYKNHLATIRNWARKETPKETARPKPQSDYDKFMGKLQEMYNEEE
jgi:predicted phage replisome organizer